MPPARKGVKKSPSSTQEAPAKETEVPRPVYHQSLIALMPYVVGFALAAFAIAAIWRRSCHVVIDFGRELYVPWRVSEGAVLCRDVFHNYGPLSQSYHAVLFKMLGPGLSRLMWSNAALYLVLLALLTRLLVKGWNAWVATAGVMFFVLVFSFAQLMPAGNYNYLTPYLHETTHGLLASVVLVMILSSDWLTGWRKWAAAGLCCGVSVLLKPEPMLACGLAMGTAIVARLWNREHRPSAQQMAVEAVAFALGLIVPVAVAIGTFAFWANCTWEESFQYANMAWYGVFKHASIVKSPDQLNFLGTDNIAANLWSIAVWSLGSFGLLALVTVPLWATSKQSVGVRWIVYAVLAGVAVYLGLTIKWGAVGRTLPAFLLAALIADVVRAWKSGAVDSAALVRLLLGSLAIGFLARMALNPRIGHYGFVQAPLAAMMAVGFVLYTTPQWARLEHRERVVFWVLAVITGGLGLTSITVYSQRLIAANVYPVGVGDDRVYMLPPERLLDAQEFERARAVVERLDGKSPMLVLPEGVFMNYLYRVPSPIPEFQFLPSSLVNGQGKAYVERLRGNPPAVVVLLCRDTREHGIQRFYGESPDHGEDLIQWLREEYEVVKGEGSPLDPTNHGWAVLVRRDASR